MFLLIKLSTVFSASAVADKFETMISDLSFKLPQT